MPLLASHRYCLPITLSIYLLASRVPISLEAHTALSKDFMQVNCNVLIEIPCYGVFRLTVLIEIPCYGVFRLTVLIEIPCYGVFRLTV